MKIAADKCHPEMTGHNKYLVVILLLYMFVFIHSCTDTPFVTSAYDTDADVTQRSQDMFVRSELQPGELLNPFSPRPTVQTCQLPPPPPVGEMELVPAVPHAFQRPVWYEEPPLLAPWAFVAEQGGRVFAYQEEQPDETPELFFDVTVSRLGNEEGLLGLAFHPELGSSPYLYTYYSSSGCSSPNVARCSILSRWTLLDLTAPTLPTIDRQSELILMEIPQPYANHNGGDIRFGPDGYLYISLGDGGAGGDPVNHAQRPETILGAILRIDVSGSDPECGTNYLIPSDNPFASNQCGLNEGGRPEVWAWGLRNAWRISFDRETGDLWAADVGQDRWEEVNLIRGGLNYGWKPVEGPECYVRGCDLNAYEPPVHSYDHSIGRSITGGFVYRGEEHLGLRGYYVFSDFETGKVMAFPLEQPEERLTLTSGNSRFTSFGETISGELRLLSFDQPSVLKLRSRSNVDAEVNFPTKLSETGCFSNTAEGVMAESVIPYYLNVPFWSDEAEKERAFALPVGTSLSLRGADKGADVPVGSVLIKNFMLTSPEGSTKRVETRLMHHSDRGWVGYSYRWDEDGLDATLVTDPKPVPYEGPRGSQDWIFLNQAQCLQCHTAASNRTLGLEVQQLNRRVERDQGWYEQLTAFAEAGYLTLEEPLETLPSFRSLVYDSEDEVTEELIQKRARAYLQVNCAPCHQPGGAPTVEIDLRSSTPLNETGLCDGTVLHGDLGVEGAELLKPGVPDQSLLLLRMNQRGEEQMPPIGSHLVDFGGVALISLWINQLEGCE